MEWVSGWIQGIIIAVIISTIIEMILPEGTSKKYIKVVIGVYILFSIVSPVISKVTGTNFRVSSIFDLDEYIEASKSSSTQNNLSNQNESQIKELYLSSIKNDIREKVQNKGYSVNNINVVVEDDGQYTLKSLSLQVIKVNEKSYNNEANSKESNATVKSEEKIVEVVNNIKVEVQIEDVQSPPNIQATSNDKQKVNYDISNQDRKALKEYLSSVYDIGIKNIFINE